MQWRCLLQALNVAGAGSRLVRAPPQELSGSSQIMPATASDLGINPPTMTTLICRSVVARDTSR